MTLLARVSVFCLFATSLAIPRLGTIETTMALLVISTLPWVLGVSGMLYLVVAVCSGAAMLVCASRMAAAPAHPSRARHLLFSSLFYLPLVLVALVADKL